VTNLPPPPPEPGKVPLLPPVAPGTTPISGVGAQRAPQSIKRNFKPEDVERASPLPIVVAAVAIVSSIILWIINRHSSMLLSGIGYVLSPFVVIMALGLDNFLQRTRTSKGDWFVPNHNFGRILRILTGIALVLSYPHISGLADHISAWLAQTFPWMAS
jgi:hypothetical protein